MRNIKAWQMVQAGDPLRFETLPLPELDDNQVVVRISGCGVCHTDLGFYYDGVRTVQELPTTLGHEISGIVEEVGSNAGDWLGRAVIVPAVMPCGDCELCRKGRGTICRKQMMPGNHVDGGFASHIVVPARYLCPVDVEDETTPFGQSGVTLPELSVVADAVTTPYQAIEASGLAAGEIAVFVGAGGIGGFGVQIAKARGAAVVAIDVDERRLAALNDHGADLSFNPREIDGKAIRAEIRNYAKQNGLPSIEWKIFECSGNADGQKLAYGLLCHGATLSVVGFTMDTVNVRLSNLMAFDARAVGNWGCLPHLYPAALALDEKGDVKLEPFVQKFPLSEINDVFERAHRHEIDRRPVLVPDFD